MADTFTPIPTLVENTLNLPYQLTKLYGEAFPSLAGQALFKIEGAEDALRAKVDSVLGFGYKVPEAGREPARVDWTGIQVADVNEGNVINHLGLPIFQPIYFVGRSYPVLVNGVEEVRPFSDLRLPATATASFKRNKHIVKTDISGGAGSVKELFGFSDWDVTIQGIIMTEGNHQGKNAAIHPDTELKQLLAWDEVCDSIEVSGAMFNLLKIKRLVIERITISKIAGRPNVIPFMLQCYSDEPIELIINAK